MPIENEFKYVLHRDYQKFIGMLCTLSNIQEIQDIRQIYMDDGGRFRCITSNQGGGGGYWFTYKHKVPHRPPLEIEKKISQDDFELACMDKTVELRKWRFKTSSGAYNAMVGSYLIRWDIDFLVLDGEPYFGMIEAEVPEFIKDAPEPLDFMQPFVALAVKQCDNEIYTNRRLADKFYAEKLAERGY